MLVTSYFQYNVKIYLFGNNMIKRLIKIIQKAKHTKAEKIEESESCDPPYSIRNSRTDLERYKCLDKKTNKYVENKYIKELRDNEELNKAPFSDRIVLIDPPYKTTSGYYEYPPEAYHDMETQEKLPDGIMNVKITRIIGFNNCGQMIPCKDMTFKELLFEKIWGCSLTKETIEYFISNDMKAYGYDGFREMPEDPENSIDAHRARGGISLSEREDGYFIVSNGKHRVLMAMYAIYQKYGADGYLKKVRVIR